MRVEKGITLIALIITIIVLLLLAGVTINALFGENSIINFAKKAVDEYNKQVNEEQKILEEIKEQIKNDGNEEIAGLQLVEKGESWIKVSIYGNDYENYQFSIDNGEYVLSNTSEYTFNNLEITTVTGIDNLVEEGTKHIIKAKAKNKNTGEIEELNSIQVATDVLVVSNQVPYFRYEDNGEGITITELVPFSDIVTDTNNYSNWENFFNNLQDTIVVPTYIDGKPVTKLTSKFVKQVANIDTYEKIITGSFYTWGIDGTPISSGVDIPFANNQVGVQMKIDIEQNMDKLLCIASNQLGIENLYYPCNKLDVNFKIQNGIVKNGDVNLILPPTLKEITENNLELINTINNEYSFQLEKSVSVDPDPDPAPDPDPDPDDPDDLSRFVYIIGHIEANNSNVNNTTIYMIGKTINEKELLKEQIEIDWNMFPQVKIRE